jgi:hypothetical protein
MYHSFVNMLTHPNPQGQTVKPKGIKIHANWERQTKKKAAFFATSQEGSVVNLHY